ncbi:hypothetical protein M0802_006144 [Mischocyttarus mexicanus]|nr:hypothetical protein M0802_006144 [Mischocyttarus mexicanus]
MVLYGGGGGVGSCSHGGKNLCRGIVVLYEEKRHGNSRTLIVSKEKSDWEKDDTILVKKREKGYAVLRERGIGGEFGYRRVEGEHQSRVLAGINCDKPDAYCGSPMCSQMIMPDKSRELKYRARGIF